MSETTAHIVASLKEIAWLLSLRKADFFRSRAYRKAADALTGYDGDVAQLIDAGRAADLPGVGAKTAAVVGELHQTGRCHVLSELRRRFPREVGQLARIPGLGLARLQVLHDRLGIETVKDLRAASGSGALLGIKGFGPAIVRQINAAIDQLGEQKHRLLLPHARSLAAQLIARWSGPLGTALAITGGLRRREAAIDRIELVGTHAAPGPQLELVGADAVAALGPHDALPQLRGWQGILPDGLPVVVWLAPPSHMGAALLVTTGPQRFVDAVLPRAKVYDDEDALLTSAGAEGWTPEVRHVYADGTAAPRLVDHADLRGLVHAHTTDSDGRDDLLSLAAEAKALGYSYLTITDHSPSARYAGGVSLDDLARQGEAIRAVENEVGIRILRGTESDIQADGGLDHPIDVLRQLDIVIASIHGRFRLDPDAMTERLLKTFELPVRVIWGHPLGRLVLSRPPIQADLPRIFDLMAERGHILEVNGDPHRMDLPPAWIVHARQRGIPFVLSADAHSCRGLRMTETAVDCGRAGGLTADEVLNTYGVDRFLDAVRPDVGLSGPS